MRCTGTQKQDFHKPNLELTVFWQHKMTLRTMITVGPNHKTTFRANPLGLMPKKEDKTEKDQQERHYFPRPDHELPFNSLRTFKF